MVHKYLLKNFKVIEIGSVGYVNCSVSRLFPPNSVECGPLVELRSSRPDLAMVEATVSFSRADEVDVAISDYKFEITQDWWSFLSDVASIYVLPELMPSRVSSFKYSEVPAIWFIVIWVATFVMLFACTYFSRLRF